MQTDDIAKWLTAIWDEDEARLRHPTFCCAPWPTTDQLLARIAADRQILAEYVNEQWVIEHGHQTGWILGGQAARTTVVKLLALPHADRPGYNPEWRP